MTPQHFPCGCPGPLAHIANCLDSDGTLTHEDDAAERWDALRKIHGEAISITRAELARYIEALAPKGEFR